MNTTQCLRTLLAAVFSLTTMAALAAADLEVKTPWVRSTVPGQPATGAFMELSSKNGVTVVGASSAAAGVTEVHEMKQENGIMKMRALRVLEVPAGGTVQLAPGSYHVMLMDLKKDLKPGDTVPILLKVKGKDGKKQTVTVKAEVRDMTAGNPAPAATDPHGQMHDAMKQRMEDMHKEHMQGMGK
ncbi:MAG: copper chaperone PCu(A)C [Rhodocyclaceae bacterium]|nr:MAG: copper chaperone PCu(A)C [Rhodocyclaceae bacterium]